MHKLSTCLFAIVTLAAFAHADCSRPELANQSKDEATVQRLERAWSVAHMTGDAEFEACLLTPDFTEIRSDGKINVLSDELALAEKHRGQKADTSVLTAPTVHIHGNVAVAYGASDWKAPDGKMHKFYYADYYVWENSSWHAYFGQQTIAMESR
jgi:hypothetical protein